VHNSWQCTLDTNQQPHPAIATHAQDHQGSNIVKSNPTTHIRNIYYPNRSWKSLNHTLKEYHKCFRCTNLKFAFLWLCSTYPFLPPVLELLHFPRPMVPKGQLGPSLLFPIPGSEWPLQYSTPHFVKTCHFPKLAHFNNKDGGQLLLWNIGKHPPNYMTSILIHWATLCLCLYLFLLVVVLILYNKLTQHSVILTMQIVDFNLTQVVTSCLDYVEYFYYFFTSDFLAYIFHSL
jgi:hypothetical protein